MIHYLLVVVLALSAISVESIPLKFSKPKDIFVPSGRIFGGEEAVIQTFPYQVSLQVRDRHICGASIISSKFILTAGHCVVAPANYYSVRSGSTHHAYGGRKHQVTRIIRHEDYGSNSYGVPINDIALMEVHEPFEFDDAQRAIQLLNSTEKFGGGTKSVISGWGKTERNVIPEGLRSVEIPILNQDLCDTAYEEMGGIPSGQICASYYGTGGKDSCQGDSGGPMAINGRLAGVVSWGNGCAMAEYPGVYTEVAYFRDWIQENAYF